MGMKRLIFLVFLLISFSLFGGYAYFSRYPVLHPDEGLSFVISDLENITLNVWKISEEDFLKAVFDPESFNFSLLEITRPIYSKKFSSEEWKEFSFPLKDRGFYFATLVSNEGTVFRRVIDRSLFIVTDLEAIYFSDSEKLRLHVFDSDGDFVEGAEVLLFEDSKLIDRVFTGKDGVVSITKHFDTFYIRYGDSRFFGGVYFSGGGLEREKLFFVTDRPIYKPSDTVHFRGQIFSFEEGLYKAFEKTKVTVSIFDTKKNEVYRSEFETDELGGFSGSMKLPDTASVGLYKVNVDHGGRRYYEYFLVEEYRKPEYKVEIETDKDVYISGEVVNYLVRVKYFNGQPVAKAQVAYYVRAFPEEGSGYLVYRGTDFTDEEGNLRLGVKTEEGFQGSYRLEVIVTDESQRQIEETRSVKVYADNVLISPLDRYVSTSPGKQVRVKVKVTDLSGNPLNGLLTTSSEDSTSTVAVENGEAIVTFTPKEPKSYRIELSFGKAKTHFYVYAYCGAGTSSEFVINPATNTVKPGDELSVQILAPGKVMGVLGIVSNRVYDTIPVSFTGSVNLRVRIPKDIPEKNLFISFVGLDDNGRIYKLERLNVLLDTNFTTMKILFDKDQYEPGEMAQITIESNVDRVCLFLVDEAIYAMVGAEPPVLENFLYPYMNYPRTRGGFPHYWRLYVSRNSFRNKLASLPEEKTFADFKQNALPSKLNVREYFPDTALWIPSLKLHNGTARVSFKVPDSITSFRATAYGFSKDRFSQTESEMVVSKKFYLMPHLPSFLRESDVIKISATVFNRTSKTLPVQLTVELPENIELLEGSSSRHFLMEANSSHTETWTVKAVSASEGSFVKFVAVGEDLNDAVSMRLPVERFAFEREFYRIMLLDGKETLEIPGQFISSRIRFLDSIVPLVEDSLKRLIDFPYGCVEQTMSRFFPAVVAASAGIEVENLEEIIQRGLFKLYSYQHNDGGWGWFRFGESDDFMTCYVMEGLYFTMKAGYDVAESVLQRGIEYLRKHPSAYGSYVLDLYGVNHEPFKPESEADLVFLSLSSKEALKQLMNYVVQDEQKAYLNVYSNNPLISEIQLNSVFLRALAKWKEFPELERKVTNYLLLKKDSAFWTSTKDTSFVILALLEAMPEYASTTLKVINSENTFELKPGEERSLVPGSLTVSGKGIVEVEVVYIEVPKEAVSEGLEIKREFYKRYELLIEENKMIVDAFVPIGRGYVPRSIHPVEKEQTEELYILPYKYWKKTIEYRGVPLEINGAEVKIKGETYTFFRIETFNGLILVFFRNEALIYDTEKNTITRYLDVTDAGFMRSGPVFLMKGFVLVGDEKIPVPEDVTGLSCTMDEILLRGENKTYWYRNGEFVDLPFVARRVFFWDGKKLVAENIRFSGSSKTLRNRVFEVVFDVGDVKIELGDIIKTVVRVKGDGNYLIVEDFIPSCAQVLSNYREKGIEENKFSYSWYSSWNAWYSGREIRTDRVALFARYLYGNSFDYVWRATAEGVFHLLPARVYPMYSRGLYAHTDPDVLFIGADFIDGRDDQP
ncbi:hypothetical protein THMA_1006 [Thermotoga maritima MSB8]|uniref:alpha-2-macroglobulin family protein n=1 Tax=Thermotoga maritima TaxID=2336 RepID=UPI00059C34EE|nr:alpha-2-macroglobulin [Thermotoga maritima]AKE26896.1 hypothetical protein THMC_1006 [Thermotoga maritima]AKE28761.1 hypothetical protein THMA_1006 [Thermotoga maritima MSB8]AKE30634.1 hypothetical protein THMB_1006 [Thermotoga maritima]